MLNNALRDMRDADIVLVPVELGSVPASEIWRSPNGAGRKD